jgi:cytochrome c5
VLKLLKNSAVKMIGLLLLGVTLSAYGVSDKQHAAIEERIKPVGTVCLEGDTSCGAVVAAAGVSAKSPKDIYNSNCMACHSTGAAGAPKLGDTADWGGRLAKGIDQLYVHAINGFNGMPPKGLCMSCSEDEIKGVVDYIVENSQ